MVVDNIQELIQFAEKATSVFVYPIMKDDRLHNHSNSITALIFINTDTQEVITLSINHPEGIFTNENLDWLYGKKVYCYNTMAFIYAGIDTHGWLDVGMQYYLYTGQGFSPETSPLVQHYNRLYQSFHRVNELIPLHKHEQYVLGLFEMCWVKKEQPGLEFYQNNLLQAFYNIEKNGILVDKNKFGERFGNTLSLIGDRAYTQYNYYTTTGRPSNRFGGINFAALNKDDETRESFVADGTLLELDFNSYHPRLIAQIIDYDFGDDNVYEHLACHYHNTDNPTPKQIEEAKEGTFRQLYGGIQQQYLHIPFFSKTNDMARYLWNKAEEDGYIESPISGRRLITSNYQDLTLYTLFNYFIQMYETETNVMVLNSIHRHLKDKVTKPILYTYDAILFDVQNEERDYLLKEVIPSCIDLQKFPIKIKEGSTYKTLGFSSAE